MCDEGISDNFLLNIFVRDKFSKMLQELEHYSENEQKEKIEEMNGLVEEMDEEMLDSVVTEELFDNMHKMIKEEKFSMENLVFLLKCIGCCNSMNGRGFLVFERSALNKWMIEMIIDENEKNTEEKNEKLLVDLCECYLVLLYDLPSEFYSIFFPCLLNVASNKDEDKKTQKEVEMALFALCCIGTFSVVPEELYLNKIKEIIEYHQEHRNLTRFAYQSALLFLKDRLNMEEDQWTVIAKEEHFVREVAREMSELMENVDWKKKEEKKTGTKMKDFTIVKRWCSELINFFLCSKVYNEEFVGLIACMTRLCRAAKENYEEITIFCCNDLVNMMRNRPILAIVHDMMEGGAFEFFLEEINRPMLDENSLRLCLMFFIEISSRMKEKEDDEKEEAKRKRLKRHFFERMEEEGFEDAVLSFYKRLDYINRVIMVTYP
ncbi:uncharacterized protein MONOS_17585 [Monocercomonoides exilis]|uniref:uncharacterized protein n=1 Tax=Monocercomonoides exilis TaxID=2049356 RepID=UPI00355A8BF8|nr:hypothetical protein MONOS_17585 [Monocercomonoides exilis]